MSQFDFGNIDPDTKSGTTLASDLNDKRDAQESQHLGAGQPSYVRDGMIWVKDVSSTVREVNYHDGTNDIVLGVINPTAHSWTPYIAGAAPGSLASANSISDIPASLTLSGVITPTSLSADQNDYNPTSLSTSVILRLASNNTTTRTITGLAGGASGRLVIIINVGTSDLKLADQSASSSAGNRFLIGADFVLKPNQVIELEYDNTSTKWRPVALPQPATLVVSDAISANTDDYAPSGILTATILRITTDTNRDLTGITTGSHGRTLTIFNVGSNSLTLKHDATSTAANRFSLPSQQDLLVSSGGSVALAYDVTSSRWRPVATSVSASAELVFISKTTAANAANLDITTGIDSTYDFYEMRLYGLYENGNNNGEIYMSYWNGSAWVAVNPFLLTYGAPSPVGGVGNAEYYIDASGAGPLNGGTVLPGPGPYSAGNKIHLGSVHASTNNGVRGVIRFDHPSEATLMPVFDFETSHRNNGGQPIWCKGASMNTGAATAFTQIRFTDSGAGSGITGEVHLYGYRKH